MIIYGRASTSFNQNSSSLPKKSRTKILKAISQHMIMFKTMFHPPKQHVETTKITAFINWTQSLLISNKKKYEGWLGLQRANRYIFAEMFFKHPLLLCVFVIAWKFWNGGGHLTKEINFSSSLRMCLGL